jgi:hypothetical protein
MTPKLLSTAVCLLVATLAHAQPLGEPPPASPTEPAPGPAPATPAAESAAPPVAVAPPAERGVLTFALSVANIFPQGDVAGVVGSSDVQTMSEEFGSGGLAAGVRGGYRFPFGLTVGAFFEGGPTPFQPSAGNGLCTTYRCTDARVFRYGLEALYHFRRDRDLQPFLGAGVGWERSGYDVDTGGGTATVRYLGTLFDARIGADYQFASRLFVGAYVADAVGKYDTVELTGGGSTATGDIAEKKTHGWLQFGLRLRYDVPL